MMYRSRWTVAALGPVIALWGCAHLQSTPDERGDPVVVAHSPSYEAAIEVVERQRPEPSAGYPPNCAFVQRGTVQHWPIWYSDPFADHGSENRRFAITGEDFLCVPYSTARFCLNTAALPISAIVNPPWQKMYSDGRVGTLPFQDYDVNSSPLATAGGALMEEPLVAPDTVKPRLKPSAQESRLVPVADPSSQPATGKYHPLTVPN